MRKRLALLFPAVLFATFCRAQTSSPPLPVQTIAVNGATFSYVEQGKGETLLLVHGWAVDYRSFAQQVTDLSSRFRVLAYSRRYNHPNPRQDDSSHYTPHAQVADLAALIGALGRGPVHVAGHSAGANIALMLARQHPDLVRSLILGEPFFPNLIPEEERDQMAPWMATMQEGRRFYAEGDVEGAALTITEGIVGKGAWEATAPWVRRMLLDNLPRELEAEKAAAPQQPPTFSCEEAKGITAPVLLLEGANTIGVFKSVIRELRKCLRAPEHALLPDTTHALQMESAAAYRDAVLGFLTRLAVPPEVKKMTVNGTEISYLEQGKGEPVILLHGALHDYRSWSSQMKPLSQRYRVIAYSRRYHWPNVTSGDGDDYLPSTHVADLAALIKGLGLGRVHLMGHSAGGNIAIRTAREHPELVRSLILGEGPSIPVAGTARPSPPAFRAQAHEAFQNDEMERGVAISLNGAFGEGYFEKGAPERRQVWMDNAASLKFMLAAAVDRQPFTCEEARSVHVPTLILVGEHSPARFQVPMQALLHCLPAAERATVPNAGHGLQLNNPDDFSEIVLSFLAKQ